MAIVSISRIQHRRGLHENLPQLSSAEIGWSVDQQRLFIGNGTTEEGSPIPGNTEILTEHSNIIGITGSYLFKGEQGGYTVATGPSNLNPSDRSLQDKLDDFANARDFGAVGDGLTNDVEALNRATRELHREALLSSPIVRRTLHIPAGKYLLSGSALLLSPYVKLHGDGKFATIIVQSSSHPVAQTTDSKYQSSANIGDNSATYPGYNVVENLTLQNNANSECLVIDSATGLILNNVGFVGSQTNLLTPSTRVIGIRINAAKQVPKNIYIGSCDFDSQTYAIYADKVQNLVINASKFTSLYQGVVLGFSTDLPSATRGVRIINSSFDNIAHEGIAVYNGVTGVISAFNDFNKDVANNLTSNPVTPHTSVISFTGDNCYSFGDTFDRTESATIPAINLNGKSSFATLSEGRFQIGKTSVIGSRDYVLDPSTIVDTPIGIVGLSGSNSKFEYVIERNSLGSAGNTVRNGCITVASTASDIVYSDDYIETNSTDVILTPKIADGVVTLHYRLTSAATSTTINLKANSQQLI